MRSTLEKEFVNWPEKLQTDEWYYCNLREKLAGENSTEEAWQNIPIVLDLALDIKDEFVFIEILELVLVLADKSNTTEQPKNIKAKLKALYINARMFKETKDYCVSKIDEIKRYYRIKNI